jgi:hypothetical protein
MWLHAPQLLLSVSSLTHAPPQRAVGGAQPLQAPHWQLASQLWVPPTPGHVCVEFGWQDPCPVHADHADHAPPLHVRVWLPQSPHASDDAPTHPHWPPWQEAPIGHAMPQPPQLFASLVKSTHWAPHIEKPPLQAQALHAQVAPQVSDPLLPQVCVAPGAHPPWPEHADQADQVPPVQVRVSMPQLPHVCDEAPLQAHWPFWHADPVGHAFPHVPQLPLSLVTFTQAPPQAV